MKKFFYSTNDCFSYLGNPRVTPEVTRDVCLLARLMAANLYFTQIEELMFEVSNDTLCKLIYISICTDTFGSCLTCQFYIL